jgi:hypothetical protein
MRRGHRVWSGVLLALATLVLILGMTAVWVQRQVLDREEWVDTSVELLENDDVRRAIGLYLIDELYANVDVAGEFESVLPERLQSLAEPAAGALRRAAEQNAGTLLGTSVAQDLWRRANERAHQLFERVVVDEESGEVTIDLQPLIEKAAERGGLLGRAAEQLPPDAGQLEVLRSDQLDGAQTVVRLLRPLAIVFALLAAALYIAAVFLAPDRRRTVIYVGACLLFAAIAVLAVRRVGGNTIVDALAKAPDAEDAVAATWKISTRLLVDVVSGTALFGLFLILGAWLLGPGRVAVPARRLVTPALRDQPWLVRLGLAGLLLLIVWWNPVPWTGKPLPILILAILAFAWLELIRRRALEEESAGGDSPPPPAEPAAQPS